MIDIHPEDLLDREREGSLSPEERAYLDAHLERCSTCRVERMLALDCAAERELIDAEFGTSGKRSGVGGRVPRPMGAPPQEHTAPSRPSKAGAAGLRPGRAASKVAIVSAALLLAGGAAALGGGLPWVSSPRAVVSVNVTASAPTEPAVPPLRPRSRVDSPATSASAPGDSPDAGSEGAAELPASPTSVSAASPAPARPSVPDAAELFAAGAAARRDGNYDKALRFFDRLIEHHPASPEAKTAQAVRARILLDLGRAGAAEKGFREAAREPGPLSEVALVGQAQALRQSGRVQAEAAVWRELLRRYPASAQAAVAKARLRELGE